MPIIQRPYYLERLVAAKHNGMVKIVTGIRRSGKSFLLFKLFKEHLLDSGVSPDHILEVDLEQADWTLRNPSKLRKYIEERIIRDGKWTYVLIDEIQMCDKILRIDIDIELTGTIRSVEIEIQSKSSPTSTIASRTAIRFYLAVRSTG